MFGLGHLWGRPPARTSHPRRGSEVRFSTGLCLARFIRPCYVFPEWLLRLFWLFFFVCFYSFCFLTRCARDKSFARSYAQIKLDLCECLRVYIYTSARLIVNRHSVDLIMLKPPSASYKETVGQEWNQCPSFFFFLFFFLSFFSKRGLHIISFITMRISFPTF